MYEEYFKGKIEGLQRSGSYRDFVTITRSQGRYPKARHESEGGRRDVVVWCSNDYLGMSQNEAVLAAMHEAIEECGAGSGGSRNIGGTHRYYNELESTIAAWHDKESALAFPTGYGSNDSTLQCLLRMMTDAVVFSDESNHASIINGIRSTKAERHVFRHNDVGHLEELLLKYPLERPKIVVFESIYSMDGDTAPVAEIVRIAKRHNAFTYLDEVHAIGMYGPKGAGVAAAQGVHREVDIIQGTMAKAIGVIGGYIAGSTATVDAVRSFASGFIFTTSLPPAVVAACDTSIRHLMDSGRERDSLHEKTIMLRSKFRESGIQVMSQSDTHVLPVVIGDSVRCKQAARRLLDVHGVYLQPINSPTVPQGTERFRVNVTPNHTEQQMDELVEALREVFDHYGVVNGREVTAAHA